MGWWVESTCLLFRTFSSLRSETSSLGRRLGESTGEGMTRVEGPTSLGKGPGM